MSRERKRQEKEARKNRNRRTRETVVEASKRRRRDNEKHRQNRAAENQERHTMHLQQRCENDEKKRQESPGFDATVDKFYDYVEEDPENSFIESDQTVAAGAGLLYARNGTHLYGQTLTFQLPPPTVEEVEARIEHDIQQNMLDGAKARAIATVVGTRPKFERLLRHGRVCRNNGRCQPPTMKPCYRPCWPGPRLLQVRIQVQRHCLQHL
jgi:hypothetical protein